MPNALSQAQDAAVRARQIPIADGAAPGGPAPGGPAPGGPAPGGPTDVAAVDAPDGVMEGSDVSTEMAHVAPTTGNVNIRTKMIDANPDEQKEYTRALTALSKVLYSDDKAQATIIQALSSTKKDKVDPIAKTGILLIKQLDDQVDLDESVVAQITQDTTERLIEMAEARFGVSYSEVEYQQALGTTWEGVMAAFGVDEADYKQFTESLAPEDMITAKRAYQGALTNG